MLAFNISQLFAVRCVGAPHIKITVLKAALAFVEHIKCFRLVFFNRGNCSFKHRLGFLCSAELSCRDWDGSETSQNHRPMRDGAT